MRLLLMTAAILFSLHGHAELSVMFIEIRDTSGKRLQLEPNGRFSHVAISYRGLWLHTHPYRGVELVDRTELEKIGTPIILRIQDRIEPTAAEIKRYLNKPYDPTYSWEGERYYCSKLVGKILKIEPLIMNFQAPIWIKLKRPTQREGLSPDDIYNVLLHQSLPVHTDAPRCERLFHSYLSQGLLFSAAYALDSPSSKRELHDAPFSGRPR